MMLVSLGDLKEFLGITTTQFDTLLTNIIEGMSAQMEKRLNRGLRSEERTRAFPAGLAVYSLPAYPVDTSAPLTVTVDGVARTQGVEFRLWAESGMMEFREPTLATFPGDVQITWTGGYVETAGVLQVPDDLRAAAQAQCSYLFRRRDDLGLTSVSMPDGSVGISAPAGLLPGVEQVLGLYRRHPR